MQICFRFSYSVCNRMYIYVVWCRYSDIEERMYTYYCDSYRHQLRYMRRSTERLLTNTIIRQIVGNVICIEVFHIIEYKLYGARVHASTSTTSTYFASPYKRLFVFACLCVRLCIVSFIPTSHNQFKWSFITYISKRAQYVSELKKPSGV